MMHRTSLFYLSIAATVALRASVTQPQSVDVVQQQVDKCSPYQDCSVTCTSTSQCNDMVIECPIRGSCNIECVGTQSCQNLVVNASQSQYGHVNVVCENNELSMSDHGDHDQCNGLKVYGSVMDSNTGDVSIACNGDLHACLAMAVFCPLHGDCLLACNGDSACAHSMARGPEFGDLIVSCNAPGSCFSATLNGQYSELMEVSGCLAASSCTDLAVYVPPYTNSTPNCFIEGNDNLQISHLYAVHGWSDIDFSYAGVFASPAHSSSVMYCGDGYHDQCTMATDAWSCAHYDDACSEDVLLHNDGDHDGDSDHDHDTDDHGDSHDSDHDTGYNYVPDQRRDFESGAVGMLIIGGVLLALVIVCIVCGGIKKAHSAASRKLSDIGWKSPFKSPRKAYVEQQQYMQQVASSENQIASYMDGVVEHSVDASYMDPHEAGHTLYRPESHTAHIHRPNSHSANFTAAIHRPNSANSTSAAAAPVPTGSAHSSSNALHGSSSALHGAKHGGYKVVQKYATASTNGHRRSSRSQHQHQHGRVSQHSHASRHDAHAVRAAVHGHVIGHDHGMAVVVVVQSRNAVMHIRNTVAAAANIKLQKWFLCGDF
eukprot:CAMPEP_0202725722 /NCGR_PEP_ID=MMETSP1385-20130828/184248_1 /ASSEMBLY_ACC=CAM_ASM_000861 /TAXON_ID=933848 /ORGANISM="Elphidium margaritaceum" /LENGTH=598 /DNA_ID=CAMNT_0049391927 /DNA_START=81 /DNA_END=1877 /DNA_ORIENTATION=+